MTRPVAPRPDLGDIVRQGGRRWRVLDVSPVVDLDPAWVIFAHEVDELGRLLPDRTAWRAQMSSHDRTPPTVEPPEDPADPCPACGGSGEDHVRAYGPDVPPCPDCRGTGERP